MSEKRLDDPGLRAVVNDHADAMRERLAANSGKYGWERMTPGQHLRRLKQEVGELTRALERGESVERIRKEAADVSNFAAFLAATYEVKS